MEPDALFGKYRIVRQLGRGGMGVVYLVEDTTLLRLVALKVLDRSVTSSPHFAHRFQQEARMVASLNHPNIVPVHALSQIGEDWVLEMPYISGGSLMDAEEQGRLDLNQLLGCIRDILLALAACHEADIIHRDVKPSNILLNEQSRGMLSDFGLASLLSLHQQDALHASHSSSLFFGTPRYAPPESWEEGEPTPAWDIYSTGMVLYEAIAGKTPYDAQTPLSLMKQLLERPVVPLKEIAPQISEKLSDLVSAMLARDPAERPADVDAVLECFWALPELSGDSTSPPVLVKSKRPPRVRPFATRRNVLHKLRLNKTVLKTVSVLLVAVISLAVLGFGLYIRAETQTPAPTVPVDGDVHWAAFDTVKMETQETLSGYCLGRRTEDGSPWQLLEAGPAYLRLLDVVEQPDDQVEIQGHWADYNRAGGMVFRYGTVSGKGRWVRRGQDLSVAFSFLDADDMDTWQETAVYRRVDPAPSGPAFICELVSSEAVSALIYNELAPRGLPWTNTLTRFFLDLGLVRASVPFYETEAEAFTLDGRLEESMWRPSLGEEHAAPGLTPPATGPEGSFLRAWHTEDTFYIGIHVATALAQPQLLMGLQTVHTVPAEHGERRLVQADNGTIVSAKISQGGIVKNYTCDWEVKIAHLPEALEAEIRIPISGLNMAAADMTVQQWLLNLQVGPMRGGTPSVIARWGHEVLEHTDCGIVLVFEH